MLANLISYVKITSMIQRILYNRIKDALEIFPSVAILGPRQVGKTTLAFQLTEKLNPDPVYLDLEKPSDHRKLIDPEYYLGQYMDRLVIIDEIQRVPELFTILRGLIDTRKRQGQSAMQYLLLGSASKLLLKQSSESLAGRIIYTELFGFNVIEVGRSNINKLWIRGGFPDSFLAQNNDVSFEWRESLITTYTEREILAAGLRISTDSLRRFWTMLAHNQGEQLNSARLASSLGVSNPTITRYLDLLVDLFMVRVLRPWSSNVGKRLVKAPKIYIRDSGITHSLLNIRTLDQLLGHSVSGSSWEGFVIENIASVIGHKVNMYFYRTAAGAEIDLLIELKGGALIAVEIKMSMSPTVTKSLYEAIDSINPAKTFIIYSGQEQYKIGNNIEVISLPDFLDTISNMVSK